MSFYIATAIIAYLLGSIPFGYILVRVFRGQDIRASGSGNIGATNVARSAPGLGILTLVLDAAKGLLAVLVFMPIAATAGAARAGHPPYPPPVYTFAALAAVCAILGHM